MKIFFERDSVLKIVSFVIALLLWFYIIAVVDPSVDITVKDIPVRFTNQDILENRGLCVVNESKITVELKISGSRKRIANIDNKNIYASVNLESITKSGTYSLPIAISIPYEYNEIVNKKPYNANVVVDKIVEEERNVRLITSGSVENGYIAGTAVPDIKTVTLKGAESLIARISEVGAAIDYGERTAEITESAELFFFDTDGKRISSENVIYDMVEISVSSVNVTCPIYKLKTVPIELDVGTAVKESYRISMQPSNITVYADTELLNETERIFTESINLEEAAEEGTQTLKLIIPENVMLRDGITEVTVKVEKRD